MWVRLNYELGSTKPGRGWQSSQPECSLALKPGDDYQCDEYPFFAWLLRALAFQRLGYDPDGVFSGEPHDAYGFVGSGCQVMQGVATAVTVAASQGT